MTKDELLIAKLQSKRALIITVAQTDIAAIDAEIALIRSTPRYMRPKRQYVTQRQREAEARRAADEALRAEIASKREQTQEQLQCTTVLAPRSQQGIPT